MSDNLAKSDKHPLDLARIPNVCPEYMFCSPENRTLGNSHASGPSLLSNNFLLTRAGRFFSPNHFNVRAPVLSTFLRSPAFIYTLLQGLARVWAGSDHIAHEDRATQGCDPSACARRRAGRGRTLFILPPLAPFLRYCFSSCSSSPGPTCE